MPRLISERREKANIKNAKIDFGKKTGFRGKHPLSQKNHNSIERYVQKRTDQNRTPDQILKKKHFQQKSNDQ